MEKLSLELNFIDNFCQNIEKFCEPVLLGIHSKPTEFTRNWIEIEKNFQCALQEQKLGKSFVCFFGKFKAPQFPF